jgi:hypothetical protein
MSCISDADVTGAILRICPTKYVGPDEIPNVIIKGCSEIFTPFTSILNLGLLTKSFLHYLTF